MINERQMTATLDTLCPQFKWVVTLYEHPQRAVATLLGVLNCSHSPLLTLCFFFPMYGDTDDFERLGRWLEEWNDWGEGHRMRWHT